MFLKENGKKNIICFSLKNKLIYLEVGIFLWNGIIVVCSYIFFYNEN